MSRRKSLGRPQQLELEKEKLRRKILDEAGKIIREEGFSALSMRKLADRVGYSAASIYLYFRNRDDLAKELSREGYGKLLDHMRRAESGITDAYGRVEALLKAYVAFGVQNPETYRLFFTSDTSYLNAVFAEKDESEPAPQAFALLVGAIGNLQAAGYDVSSTATTTLAETFLAAVHGIVSLKLACPNFPEADADELCAVMNQLLLRSTERGRLSLSRRKEARSRGSESDNFRTR